MAKKNTSPRSYSDFSVDNLKTMFGIRDKIHPLHLRGELIAPSDWLIESLNRQKRIPSGTEKAKSELRITPILLELQNRNPDKFNFFSGYTFDVDSSLALRGRCDYLLTKDAYSTNIEAPIMGMFEAKDDNIDKWIGQCGAEMYAARLFNQQHEEDVEIIYGAVTNGQDWLFLKLEGLILYVDTEIYGMSNLPELLGVLEKVILFYDKSL